MSRLIVLVTGPPAAGKTTVARGLAERLSLPLIAKDDIKESLSDSLELTDYEWSKRLGAATWELIFVLMERFMSVGESAIFESNFYPELHRDRMAERCARFGFVAFEIHCTAEAAVLAKRNNERERHPVHRFSSGVTPELAEQWNEANAPLELGEHLVRVDTTDGEPVDLDDIVARIEEVRDG